jgi:hypothetical protein
VELKPLLARASLVLGIAFAASQLLTNVPKDQELGIRVGDVRLSRLDAVFTAAGEDEPVAGFSEHFAAGALTPPIVRRSVSLPNGKYSVHVTLRHQPRPAGEPGPIPAETSFERRVNLDGGAILISSD